ncbi:MAG: hypothetical protein ABW215_15765 [Kibdelosporangium sp.]
MTSVQIHPVPPPGRPGSGTSGGKTALREALLAGTIEHAWQTDYYRGLWADAEPLTVRTVADLARLPVISKTGPDGGAAAIGHPDRVPAVALHSSGTTGAPFIRYRSAEEIEALADLHAKLNERVRARSGDDSQIVHLTTVSARHHGNVLGTVATDRGLTLSMASDKDLARAVDLLRRGPLFPDLPEPKVQLSGSPDDLVVLVCALTEAGMSGLVVHNVVVIGDYLSRLHREYLARALPGARVIHRYSLSEITGGATACDRCSSFHFDSYVLPEVVALDDDQPIAAGLGRLVLTELYPFSQYQPMVRYDTGDLVELVRSPCEPAEVSMILAGRRAHAPMVRDRGATRVVYRPIALREALEALPDVARAPLNPKLGSFRDVPGSAPLARVEFQAGDGGLGKVVLTVVIAFPPHLYPEHLARARAAITTAVRESCPELAANVHDGVCELVVDLTGDRSAAPPFVVRGS